MKCGLCMTIAASVLGGTAMAEDDVFISWPAGVADLDATKTFVDDAWNITLDIDKDASANCGLVTVRPASVNDPIRFVRVTVNGNALSPCDVVVISILPNAAFEIPFVQEATKVGGDGELH